MTKLAGDLVGKTIVVRDLIGAGAAGGAVSPANQPDGYQLRLPAGSLQAAQESLRCALLCAAEQSPLSLEAALALAGSERGDLVAAGGELKKIVELEAYIPFFAQAAANIPPQIDRLPGNLLGSLRWRAELQPVWCQQRYAYWKVAAP